MPADRPPAVADIRRRPVESSLFTQRCSQGPVRLGQRVACETKERQWGVPLTPVSAPAVRCNLAQLFHRGLRVPSWFHARIAAGLRTSHNGDQLGICSLECRGGPWRKTDLCAGWG